jgi:hypothetical protein
VVILVRSPGKSSVRVAPSVAPPPRSSDLILIRAEQVLAPTYESAIGSSPQVSGKAWRLAALLSFRCHPHACRTVDSLLGSRVGRGVSAALAYNSAVAFGSGPPVRRNDP